MYYQLVRLEGMKMKFVKVMFGQTSGADSKLNYKIDEVNIADNWNPSAEKGRDFGGFNYTTEDCILRWLHRGDTIYDVEVPADAEIVKIDSATTVYRANKIIISNPRKVDDDLALHFYEISKIPEKSYYKALGAVSIMNYKKTAYAIIRDKVNKNNIDEVLNEWNDFIFHGNKGDRKDLKGLVEEVLNDLKEIKSDLLISKFIDKEPYYKKLTNDKIINLTGESGSGKSYYTNQYKGNDEYIIIDTDILFSDQETENKYILDLRKIIKSTFNEDLKGILIPHFDECYKIILDYFKDIDKTIIIDSAQYRNIKDISLLKGEIIVIRTSIDKCYQRCVERYLNNKPDALEEEIERYKNRKIAVYRWYLGINKLLEKLDLM